MKTLGEIATYVGGQLFGDASLPIKRIVHPALVEDESDLALVFSSARRLDPRLRQDFECCAPGGGGAFV